MFMVTRCRGPSNEDNMSTKSTTLNLSYLTIDRSEVSEEIEVGAEELSRLSLAGRKIIENGGEFSDDEIDDMDDVQFARLAASDARGYDAYSLACASYLI